MKTKLFLASLAAAGCISQTEAQTQIRWGSSGNPLTGLTVTWTNPATNTDSINWGYTSAMGTKAAAVKRTGNGTSGSFFKHVLGNVTAGATITYSIKSGSTWSAAKTFKTAPDPSTNNFCFAGMGDSRDGMAMWTTISNKVKAANTAFTIFTGDLVGTGSTLANWTSWFTAASSYLETNLYYPSQGNHEATSTVGTQYYSNAFDMPIPSGKTSNLYYSFKYGNALFVCLNSEGADLAGAQYTWAKGVLDAAKTDPTIVWKVVYDHKPWFTYSSHANEMNSYMTNYWKTFDDDGVDFVVSGHDHVYERMKPINRNVSTTAAIANYFDPSGDPLKQGRCQMVLGGSGAPLYSLTPGTGTPLLQKGQAINNYAIFCVNGKKIDVTAYNSTGAVIETFSIDKNNGIGIEESANEKFNPISVYPNPAQTNITLKCTSANLGEGVVKIYNFEGQEVKSEKVTKSQELFESKVDLSGIAPGMYFIELTVGQQTDRVMFVVE